MSVIQSAAPGFDQSTWTKFMEQGFLVVPQVLTIQKTDALRKLIESYIPFRPAEGFNEIHVVEKHPEFSALIDHAGHIGFVYDLFGESSKLLLSQFFVRPPHQPIRNDWHFDGPRQLPFSSFTKDRPLRLKVGYWLTDLPQASMGNLIVIPGSHHWDYLPEYKTQERHPQEQTITAQPGDLILMAAGLWHRVDENSSESARINLFFEYGPSWIVNSDRWRCHPAFLETLNREQQILMRDYEFPNLQIKLPAEDYPLFADSRSVEGRYSESVPKHLRRHLTRSEEGFK